jgi:cell division protease FtsH
MLMENRSKLEALARELLTKEMLQYCQVEEILGKRPGGPEDDPGEVDCSKKASENGIAGHDPETAADIESTEKSGLSATELAELEAAAERLRQSRNVSDN